MIHGYDAIKRRIDELNLKGFDRSNKEDNILDVLGSALEMTARGFTFKNLDLYKSHYKDFIIDEDGKSLIPPFRSIDGLGDIPLKVYTMKLEKVHLLVSKIFKIDVKFHRH